MKQLLLIVAAVLCLSSCRKAAELLAPSTDTDGAGFTRYVIRSGQHYCETNNYRAIETDGLQFTLRFDSSAIYQTTDPSNQDDINKLWGFSDNNADHHSYSARFGWRWSGGSLRLFGYVYNAGQREELELTTIPIGSEVACSLLAEDRLYRFVVNGHSWTLPRTATTTKAKGYQLYPYFGGDETAPHEIRIWIRDEKGR